MDFTHLLFTGEWENQTLSSLTLTRKGKELENALKKFIQRNIPEVKNLIFKNNESDFTEDLKFNYSLISVFPSSENPYFHYYLERNKELEKIRKSFFISIFHVKDFDVQFYFD
jgi:hypothetical protein